MRSRSDRLENLSSEAAQIRREAKGRRKVIWPARFRRTAVELMKAGYLAPELSRHLGVPVMTLYHWKQTDGLGRKTGGPKPAIAATRKPGARRSRSGGRAGFTALKITPPGSEHSSADEGPHSHRHSVSGPYGLVASQLSLLELAWLWQYLLRLDLSDPMR